MAVVLIRTNSVIGIKESINNFLHNQSLWFYFVGTFILSWICWGISFSLKGPKSVLDLSWLIAQIGVFAPSVTALYFYSFRKPKIFLRKYYILILLYPVLVFLGIAVILYKPDELSLLPNWLGSVLVFIASVTLAYFLVSRQILLTEQKKIFPLPRLFCALLSSWLFYPLLFALIWILIQLKIGNPIVSILGSRNTPSFYSSILTISFDFLFGGSVGEEIGWRGYALPLLMKKYHPLKASLILGIVWSLWHLPIDLTAGFGIHGVGGVSLRILTVCPMSIIITWFYLHFQFGIVTSLLLHSGINIIPALGVSHYELTFGILIVIQLLICSVILIGDKSFGH